MHAPSSFRFDDSVRATFAALEALLEPADAADALELDSAPELLTITLKTGKQLIVSRHGPSEQIWLSSPLSGGLHFRWQNDAWKIPDGRQLGQVLRTDLNALAGLDFPLLEGV